MLCGVESGNEVITQPLTFIATANAISYCKAAPIFLDVDMDTLGLSPVALDAWLQNNATTVPIASDSKDFNNVINGGKKNRTPKKITINKNTGNRISACVPVHTFGHPCRIDEITEICGLYDIPVIEDASESLGSFYKGQHTGTFGHVGVLSFNGNKIITTGGGGMLLFREEELAIKAKHLTTQAKVSHQWEFIHDEIGYNYRMPNINAALGLAQLEQLPRFLQSKRKTANYYKVFFNQLDNNQPTSILSGVGGAKIFMEEISNHKRIINNTLIHPSVNPDAISFVAEPPNSVSNYWLNCILLRNKDERDSFLKYSNNKGVITRPAWRLMNKLEMFKNCQTDNLENSKAIADRLVNIPSSVILST
jgi:dTDP-4-amino-4,6-dideoxygalactose transaminase